MVFCEQVIAVRDLADSIATRRPGPAARLGLIEPVIASSRTGRRSECPHQRIRKRLEPDVATSPLADHPAPRCTAAELHRGFSVVVARA